MDNINDENNQTNDIHISNETDNTQAIDSFIYSLESEKILGRRRRVRIVLESFIVLVITIGIIFAAFISISAYEAHNMKKDILRLHVIANSDSIADQELKLKVRDDVLEYIRPKLQNAKNKSEIIEICSKYKNNIKKIAESCIEKNDGTYDVNIKIGNVNFPTKNYPGVSLPAGDYDALEILIGNAAGKNWWCVCFPPLCLSSSAAENKDMMQEYVNPKELELITEPDKADVKIKFFFLEMINDIKNAFK